jgi:hypothetical protein
MRFFSSLKILLAVCVNVWVGVFRCVWVCVFWGLGGFYLYAHVLMCTCIYVYILYMYVNIYVCMCVCVCVCVCVCARVWVYVYSRMSVLCVHICTSVRIKKKIKKKK